MELSLSIYLVFGISLCIAAPLKNEDSLSKCSNPSELLTVQGDIIKNCHDFKTLKKNETLYSTNAANNTLCILYYNSLSAYCQLNANSAKYPALQDIQSNDMEAICKQITPNFKTILKMYNIITCYSLCSQLTGAIRPECLYAYYYNVSSNLNLPDTELHINEVSTTSIKSKKIIPPENTPMESSHTTAGSKTSTGSHVGGHENPPPIASPKKSDSTNVNGDDEKPLTNNNVSPDITNPGQGIEENQPVDPPINNGINQDSIHGNSPKLPLKADEKDKKVEGHVEQPPKEKQSQGNDEHQPVDSPINNGINQDLTHNNSPKLSLKADEKGKEIEGHADEQPPKEKQSKVNEENQPVNSPINNNENEEVNQVDDKGISDTIVDNPSNNVNNDETEYNIDNINAGDRTQQQDDAINGFEESVDTAAKLEEIIDRKEEKKPDFVQDSPVDNESMDEIDGESYFFSYFMVICVLLILGYVGYHNRIKVMALLLEGKRGKRQHRGRRPNSANYHKLDTNLEEAISSNVTKNSNNVIF